MNRTKGNQSVIKTMQIVEILAKSSEPMRLLDISHAVDMPSSTVLRMLSSLVESGYVFQEDGEMRRYGLTLRFLYIGQLAANNISIREVAHPFLVSISANTGEAVCIAVKDHQKVRYVDVVENNNNLLTIRQRIGGSGYMHCTGSGKLFLSRLSEPEIDQYIATAGLTALTPYTITAKQKLMEELAKCRDTGYAIDNEECEIGMRCIAAPVYNINGAILAAVSVSGPNTRMPTSRCEKDILPFLQSAAKEISSKLSGTSAIRKD